MRPSVEWQMARVAAEEAAARERHKQSMAKAKDLPAAARAERVSHQEYMLARNRSK